MLELIDVNHHMFPPTAWELDLVASLGFTWTMFRFTLACLASVPVANLFRLIPSSPNNVLRHVYAITTGFCMLYYPFGAGILHLLVSSSVVYALMVVTPRNCGTLSWFVLGRWLPSRSLALSLTHARRRRRAVRSTPGCLPWAT